MCVRVLRPSSLLSAGVSAPLLPPLPAAPASAHALSSLNLNPDLSSDEEEAADHAAASAAAAHKRSRNGGGGGGEDDADDWTSH